MSNFAAASTLSNYAIKSTLSNFAVLNNVQTTFTNVASSIASLATNIGQSFNFLYPSSYTESFSTFFYKKYSDTTAHNYFIVYNIPFQTATNQLFAASTKKETYKWQGLLYSSGGLPLVSNSSSLLAHTFFPFVKTGNLDTMYGGCLELSLTGSTSKMTVDSVVTTIYKIKPSISSTNISTPTLSITSQSILLIEC